MFMVVVCVFFLKVYGGMRGMKGLVYETSVLDPEEVRIKAHADIWHTGGFIFVMLTKTKG